MNIIYLEWTRGHAPTTEFLFKDIPPNDESYFFCGIKDIPAKIDLNLRDSECEWMVPKFNDWEC